MNYLAVLLDDKQKWHEHIDYVANKHSVINGILCKLQRYVPKNALISVYYSLAYSYFQYAVLFWGNASTRAQKITSHQNRLIKPITNSFRLKTR